MHHELYGENLNEKRNYMDVDNGVPCILLGMGVLCMGASMNREDIIKLANKAYGIDEEGKPFHPSALLHLEIFANLVASAEREAILDLADSLGWVNIDHIRAREKA